VVEIPEIRSGIADLLENCIPVQTGQAHRAHSVCHCRPAVLAHQDQREELLQAVVEGCFVLRIEGLAHNNPG
jgi:hypothetical protein